MKAPSSFFAVLTLALFLPVSAAAFTIPVNDGYVTDVAGTLGAKEAALEQKVQEYMSQMSAEIIVVFFDGTQGESLQDIARAVGEKWGVAVHGDERGIVIIIDEAGPLTHVLTDSGTSLLLTQEIVDGIVKTDMEPQFREGMYAEGVAAGLASMSKHLTGEYDGARYDEEEESAGILTYLLLPVLLVVIWLAAVLARAKRWWLGTIAGIVGALFFVLLTSHWLLIPVFTVIGFLADAIISRNFRTRGPTQWWAGGTWGPKEKANQRRQRFRGAKHIGTFSGE